MSATLALYGEALRRADELTCAVRLWDGTEHPVAVARWVRGADDVDERALGGLAGPVLDVGCGPGRHLHALARRGIFGLGVDISDVAVGLARRRGARAIVGSIFDDVPSAGHWQSALLLDGNIGIGGDPARLLDRLRELLLPGGRVLVETAAPETTTVCTLARLELAGASSDWFPWAVVAASSVHSLASEAGLMIERCWRDDDRWFVSLRTAPGDVTRRAGPCDDSPRDLPVRVAIPVRVRRRIRLWNWRVAGRVWGLAANQVVRVVRRVRRRTPGASRRRQNAR